MHTTEIALCSIPARTSSSGGDGVCAKNRTKPCLLFCVHRKERYSRFEGLRIKQSSVWKENRLAIVWIGCRENGGWWCCAYELLKGAISVFCRRHDCLSAGLKLRPECNSTYV
jgi:hypothetical protein